MRGQRKREPNYTRIIGAIMVLLMVIGGIIYACTGNENSDGEDTGKTAINANASKLTHIMIMGVDQRQDDCGRSDTLMVAQVDKDKENATLLSVPRDTRVKIEGHGYDKINHAYAFGGEKLTQSTLENVLGIDMDYYIMIDTKAFERVINILDGIDIDVEKRMYYEDPWDDNGGLVINLYPGQQHMDGSTAITYVRYRDEEGDIGRITRQQKFMKAVMDKLTSPSIIPRIPAIIGQVVDSINTDLSVKQMIEFMAALKEAQSNGLQTEMLPGRPMYIGGVSYWIPDLSKLRATVANTLDVKISPDLRSATQREMLEYENSVPDDAQEIPMDEATMHKLGLDRYNEDIDSAQSKDKKHSSSKEKYTEDKEDLSDPYRDEEDTRGSKIPDKEPRENSEQNLPEAVEPAPAPSMSLPTTGKTSN